MGKKLFALCALISAFAATSVFAETYKLSNDKVSIEIDGTGNLVSLKNIPANREYAGGGGLWRIIYQDGPSLEEELNSEKVPVKITKKSDDTLELSYGGEFPVKVDCKLVGDEVRFTAEVANNSKEKVLREFQFPLIQNTKLEKYSELMLTHSGGERYPNIKRFIATGYTSYMAPDNKEVQRYILYPGKAAMNCFIVNEPENALYIANYDSNFGKTLHIARMPNIAKGGDLEYGEPTFGMVKYPFLKAGQSVKFPEYIVSPHVGDWRVSMKKYRAWADSSWYKKRPATEEYKASNGWQRVILRHQYGKLLWGYDKIPEIYTSAEESGITMLRLYGWWKEGMDAGNPHYSEDDTQGGDVELKKQIEAVQKRGGKVHLYFNGQLIDTDTEFYKTTGKNVCIKRFDGTPHLERYPFGGDGTALRVFGNKTFGVACPYCPEWIEVLKGLADRAIALGADGIYYDQMGHDIQPCADKTHGHPVPFMEINKCKHETFKKVCEYIRAKKPEMTIGVEWVCDPIAPLVDYVHNCLIATNVVGKDKFGKPITSYAPLYQYAFPEYSTCDLGLLDNRDIVRRLNLSLMRSWRSDVSVYRCRETIDAAVKYKAYLTEANKIRNRFRDYILNGTFRDRDLAECSNPQINYYTYETDKGMAVITTQWHQDNALANFTAKGYEYVEHGGLGDFKVEVSGDVVKTSMKKDALIVIVFKKSNK